MEKSTEVKEISLFYNPNADDFTIFCGGRFTDDFSANKFQFDTHPNGQANLIDIFAIEFDENLKQLKFEIITNKPT